MIGEKIKKLILLSRFGSVANFSEEIGLTKQGLYYKIKTNSFSAKDLEIIGKALNVDLTVDENEIKSSNKVNENRNEIFSLKDEIKALKKEVQEWKEKYLNLIELLAEPEKKRLSGKSKVIKKAGHANDANVMQLFA